jgi:hypothetical protein
VCGFKLCGVSPESGAFYTTASTKTKPAITFAAQRIYPSP